MKDLQMTDYSVYRLAARCAYRWMLMVVMLLSLALPAQSPEATFTVEKPTVILRGLPFKLTLTPALAAYLEADSAGTSYRVSDAAGNLLAAGIHRLDAADPQSLEITDLILETSGNQPLGVSFGGVQQQLTARVIPPLLSILPPLVAIVLALITRQVLVALFCGIWLGVTFVFDYNPLLGFLNTLDKYIIEALATPEHIFILVFSLALGGMVGVITRSGGTQGIVEKLSRYAKNSRGGQLATWAMGVLIFFDDYANTLIVGNTMRPLSDKLRISREKLSYLVDSTAAPVANIAIISTWIGYEVSLISQSFTSQGIEDNPYLIFIQTIPYNFYPLYTLAFGFCVALLLRDFGPMLRAERRTLSTGKVLGDGATPLADLAVPEIMADENTPKRWYNALVPVALVVLVVMAGLVYTGLESLASSGTAITELSLIHQVSSIIGAADAFAVLMWAAFVGSFAAIIMAISQRLLNLHQALEAWVGGVRSMIMAALILTAAWAIGKICIDLYTADYVVSLSKSFLIPQWLPLVMFLSAAVIAFATGTSWGTMAILMPIAIPLAHKFPLETGLDEAHAMSLLLSTTAAVLAGATFGDHCSPISDTTIMSSMASGSDHIDHVRTQLPYALTSGVIACLFGYIPIGFGLSNWLMLPLGFLVTFLVVRVVGKPVKT